MSRPISGHKAQREWMCAVLRNYRTVTLPELPQLLAAMWLGGVFFNCTSGRCDPGYDLLLRELGVSRRTLYRTIAALKDGRWIKVHRIGRKHVRFDLLIPSPQATSQDEAQSPAATAEVPETRNFGISSDRFEVPETRDLGTSSNPFEVPELGGSQVLEVPRIAGSTYEPVREPEGAPPARSTSRVDREGPSETTPPEPQRPSQRAPDGALTQPASPSSPSRDPPMDAARNDVLAAFADVRHAWPTDRIGDETEAYQAFVAALAARHDTNVVIDAVENLLWESGADVPWLSDALVAIEHGA
ncbi:helix-turn-helix transcriptional regulator [Bradyrhizobium sp. DASA03120]|uniref:helix-turn-helix transcriptional regulator n=1 Tax=Bradyrhizobium sp. SMVTL-02 TaxID=3395917 RepID=UPI003F6F8F19